MARKYILLLKILRTLKSSLVDFPFLERCVTAIKKKVLVPLHLETTVIKLNKVDSEGDLLNLSQNVLKIAYLRPQGALSLVKYIFKAPNRGKFA
jgi:hypothetical protein